jgi:hypothetical protein
MLLHSIKIGVSVIAVVALAYVFYPGAAATKPWPSAKTSTHHATTKHTRSATRSRKSSTLRSKQLAREEPIKPERNLRGAETHSHSGPPSKMLGGL